jgi:hypothetical protein
LQRPANEAVDEPFDDRSTCKRTATSRARFDVWLAPAGRNLSAMATQEASSTAKVGFFARMWRDYSLSIAVGTMFLVSFILHIIFGWFQYVADQQDQNSTPTLLGLHGYITYFGEWTFQNWQSEFLEVLVLIVLTTYLVHKGSPESKDGDEEMQQALQRIEQKVDQLAKAQK